MKFKVRKFQSRKVSTKVGRPVLLAALPCVLARSREL
jgi:hypothetical protein